MMNLISSNNYLYRFLRSSAFVIFVSDFAISSNYILYTLGSNPKLVYIGIMFVIAASVVL
jgi:hypothetical protein